MAARLLDRRPRSLLTAATRVAPVTVGGGGPQAAAASCLAAGCDGSGEPAAASDCDLPALGAMPGSTFEMVDPGGRSTGNA